MKVVKGMLIAGIGIGAGLVVANYLTEGAVFEAAAAVFTNAKDAIMSKTQDVVDAVTDVADDAADVVAEAI